MSQPKRILAAYLSRNFWRHTLLTTETIKLALATLGTIWLIIECAAFFLPDNANTLRGWWPFYLAAGFIFLLCKRRPVLAVSQRLAQRDVELEIRIADIFEIDAARVIGINTTFDTDIESGIISSNSLQGQFTQRFYDSHNHLDAEIDRLLAGKNAETVRGKRRGKTARYEIGTTLGVTPKGQTFYLLAIAHMNEQGVAHSTFDNIKTSLASLWEHISRESVSGLEPIAIPILGSGNTRLTETRQEIACEIIKSFIAACASRKFCEKFILAISPDDYRRHEINLYDLRDFLQHVCRYTQFKGTQDLGTGVGIGNPDSTAPPQQPPSSPLQPAADEILRAAASSDGRVLLVAHMQGQYVQAGGHKYPENEQRREAALYKAAVEALVERNFLQPVGHKGEVFEVTHDGYVAAERPT